MLTFATPIGTLAVRATTHLELVRIGQERAAEIGLDEHVSALERETRGQLEQYFAGERTEFDLPLAPATARLHTDVWAVLERLPFGASVSYGQIARELGLPSGAARAVGAAVGANPVLVIRPCHRVLGADGSLTGYAGGLDAKLWLLQHEGVLL